MTQYYKFKGVHAFNFIINYSMHKKPQCTYQCQDTKHVYYRVELAIFTNTLEKLKHPSHVSQCLVEDFDDHTGRS
jgi:hypothetical protein